MYSWFYWISSIREVFEVDIYWITFTVIRIMCTVYISMISEDCRDHRPFADPGDEWSLGGCLPVLLPVLGGNVSTSYTVGVLDSRAARCLLSVSYHLLCKSSTWQQN